MKLHPTELPHDPVGDQRGDHRAEDAKYKAKCRYTFSPLGLFFWNFFTSLLAIFLFKLLER